MNGAVPQWQTIGITYVAACSFILINVVILLCFFAQQTLPQFALTAFSLTGGILFLICGRETMLSGFDEPENKDEPPSFSWMMGVQQIRIAGMLCNILGVFYLIDAAITFMTRPKPKEVKHVDNYRKSITHYGHSLMLGIRDKHKETDT
ncbi:uncharacterized protein [Periplaneta americana]